MTVLLANNVSSALAAPITASATSMTVTNGSRFPVLSAGQYFYATIIATNGIVEIVKVNTRNGNAMSITRAQDGTNAQAFASGARVEMRINAASVRDTVTDQTGPLDTRLTTAEGDITSLEGRMTTAEGDITSLEGRMTTAEGDIVALEAFDTALATSTGSASVGFLQAGTGASLRTVQSKLREMVSVKDFGAVGDGVADDTAEIQAALDTGSDVFLPKATYLVTGLTISTQGQTLSGSGLNSILKLKNAANASLITVNANYVTLRDLGIDGNKANQTTTTDSTASGVYALNGVSNLTVENCSISNCKRNGIAGYGNHNYCIYRGNRISSPDFIGIYPSSGSAYPFARSLIANNTIVSPGQDGIGTVAIQYSSIIGNVIYQPVVAGIALEARCDYTTVTGNTVQGDQGVSGTGRGLQVNDSNGVSFVGNIVKGCTEAIAIGGGNTSRNVTVSGNTFIDCGYNATGVVEMTTTATVSTLNAYDYGLVIEGNTISDSRCSAIYMQALRNVVISNNNIRNFNVAGETLNDRKKCGICLTYFAHNNLISGNSISDATGGAHRVGILELYDSGGGETAVLNSIVDNHISGLAQDVLITFDGSKQSDVRRPTRNTSAPTAYTWARGQIQYHSFPASAGSIGWVSTDVRGGSFGTLSSVTASISLGGNTATLNSTAGLFCGMSISIAGAVTGTVIQKVNHTTNTVNLVDAAIATVSGAAVSLYNPTFKTWGVIA